MRNQGSAAIKSVAVPIREKGVVDGYVECEMRSRRVRRGYRK